MPQKPVLIIGAGISGLSIAYELQKRSVPCQVLEAAGHSGGMIQSFNKEGFELDAGPNTIAATPETMVFLAELGLEPEIQPAAAASKNRFLVRNNRLHAVSPHPFKIMGSDYISRGSKWRLFTERFRKPAPVKGEESVTHFVERRFNKEIADYLFDPILSGIYAGNPDLLSIGEVLPALPRWEREYGSVTKGLMKEKGVMGGRKIISLAGGNQTLTRRLQERLQSPVRFQCTVKNIRVSANGGYQVVCEEKGTETLLEADHIIVTTPAFTAAQQLSALDRELAALLEQVYYPRMGVLHLGFEASALPQPLEGFGFLVPDAEKLHFLGAICNSAIFPHKAPAGKLLLTVFIGGARQERYFDELGTAQLQETVVKEIRSLLGLTAAPMMQHFSFLQKAIPQLNIGHAKLRSAVATMEHNYPGILLKSNFVQGVALPALIQHAAILADRLKKN
ncbi:protoporphyrinogen oxidase [Chitinophaga qingshengii]|uniref:Coproporphyrinogen III oxidase n=1 Tax=Chitinophaga qingshengii TaxID=1569794 RepID=A0ABR7TR09_9BACT|nr:protoporphyrinogen oxidase [Chitinophaga qingshengii]MBC9932418.1 protoporphyrinogen oxidase [Chitinophaga qingshengii]